ncbi:MAG: NAD-dependent epimerase/dehydratase family protein [Patescibacteria group bacterium]|jgi:nucleoside-diphosphate-sugar epimerase
MPSLNKKNVLITGGAGYVGSVLVPVLLNKGYQVTVLDTFWFWDSPEQYRQALAAPTDNLRIIKGDIRNKADASQALENINSVIHLACLSNDPSAEIDPEFTQAVNYNGSVNVIDAAKKSGVRRFIYASSSSVYGVKSEPRVTEDLPLKPLTQYSKLKIEIENYLLDSLSDNFKGVVIRPATVCGYSPRQRLDVIVNIFVNQAVNHGKIKVFGGEQLRPNIHIKDMVRLYEELLELPVDKINQKIYNAGYENKKVMEIASLVREAVGGAELEITPTDDLRSYHICSEKINRELGFAPKHTIKDAAQELKKAFIDNKIKNAVADKYYNMRLMKKIIN